VNTNKINPIKKERFSLYNDGRVMQYGVQSFQKQLKVMSTVHKKPTHMITGWYSLGNSVLFTENLE